MRACNCNLCSWIWKMKQCNNDKKRINDNKMKNYLIVDMLDTKMGKKFHVFWTQLYLPLLSFRHIRPTSSRVLKIELSQVKISYLKLNSFNSGSYLQLSWEWNRIRSSSVPVSAFTESASVTWLWAYLLRLTVRTSRFAHSRDATSRRSSTVKNWAKCVNVAHNWKSCTKLQKR